MSAVVLVLVAVIVWYEYCVHHQLGQLATESLGVGLGVGLRRPVRCPRHNISGCSYRRNPRRVENHHVGSN